MQWMIYGANGYTGELTAREAVRRGMQPVLAGRSESVDALAQQLGLESRRFSLDDADAVQAGLSGIDVVLHCAGPFSATAAPMIEACLATKTHYLDITGEIDVFAHAHAQDARARRAGIVLLPGSGFDVVPTDCVAAQLKRAMPDAQSLVLAFEAGGGPSPGTAQTGVEGLGAGGRVRIGGELRTVPLAWKARFFARDGEQRLAMTIPWGDVYTAHVSTGIPDVEVYMVVPPTLLKQIRRIRWLGPLLGCAPVQKLLKRQVRNRVRGPSAATRDRTGSTVWGEVRDAAGREQRLRVKTPNGYRLTVDASLGIVERLLAEPPAEGGYRTPSQLMGADYVLSLPGVTIER